MVFIELRVTLLSFGCFIPFILDPRLVTLDPRPKGKLTRDFGKKSEKH